MCSQGHSEHSTAFQEQWSEALALKSLQMPMIALPGTLEPLPKIPTLSLQLSAPCIYSSHPKTFRIKFLAHLSRLPGPTPALSTRKGKPLFKVEGSDMVETHATVQCFIEIKSSGQCHSSALKEILHKNSTSLISFVQRGKQKYRKATVLICSVFAEIKHYDQK